MRLFGERILFNRIFGLRGRRNYDRRNGVAGKMDSERGSKKCMPVIRRLVFGISQFYGDFVFQNGVLERFFSRTGKIWTWDK